ncbi:MAG: hypothetical protein ACK5Q5_16660 [Planctomycetaceae bacterium]
MTGPLRSFPGPRLALRWPVLLLWMGAWIAGFLGDQTAQAQLDPQGAISNPPPPGSADFRRNIQLRYNESLRSNQPDKTAKNYIDQAIHYLVYQLGVPDQATSRVENITKIGNQLRASNTAPNARVYATDQVILRARQLLAEPSPEVRVAACHLLNSLNTSWNPDVPYLPVADVLLETLTYNDAQYIAVKVVAAEGLARILRDSPPNQLQLLKRVEISEKIAAEINRLRSSRGQAGAASKVGCDWLMWGLIRALGFSDRVMNQSRQPVVADALQKVLYDPNENWLTRARAADSLSRLPFESNTNLAVLNYEIARLLHDGAQQYNTELAAGSINPMWRRFALHIYMAYEAPNQATRNLKQGLMYQTGRSGLNAAASQIQSARGLMLPIVNNWISTPQPRPISAADVQNLATWLNANAPAAGTKLMPESQVAPPAGREATPTPAPMK